MMENTLDGSASAGMLQAIFPVDMTLVQATCTGCGTTNVMGATAAYMHDMGTIVRCPRCDNVLIRVAHAGGRYLLDMRGVRVLPLLAQTTAVIAKDLRGFGASAKYEMAAVHCFLKNLHPMKKADGLCSILRPPPSQIC